MNGVATRALFRSLLRAVRHAAQESCSIEAAVRSGVVRHDAASRAAIRLQHQARTGALAGDVRAAFRADNHGLDDGFEGKIHRTVEFVKSIVNSPSIRA